MAAAWSTMLLGLLGPRFGEDPGLDGTLGFACEIITAMWIPAGGLSAILALGFAVRRAWWPALGLALVAGIALVPELTSRLMSRGSSSEDRALRIAAVNLAAQNRDDPHMEQSLRRLNADVIVLSEVTRFWGEQLEIWFADDYPHRWLAATPPRDGYVTDGLSVAIWSRLPPAGPHEVLKLPHYVSNLRIPLRWRGRTFVLFGIHPWKPYPRSVWNRAWRCRRDVLDWIRTESAPRIVAGDFNAAPHSAFLCRLRRLGLVNASEEVHGYAPGTWPMDRPILAPLRVAIDHVMYSDALEATGFELGATTNSDHAPVVAELIWRGG